MTHYFKKWTTPGVVFKKYILFLQKPDASNRSSSTVAVSKKNSSPKENFLEKVVTLASANVYNLLYLMNSCNYCCEIAN